MKRVRFASAGCVTSAMVVSRSYHCLTLSLLVFPLLLMAAYLMTAFPAPPEPVHVNPSLASLPRTEKSWSIYPDDFYPGGGYAEFPNGKVRYWLLGPETGKKVVLIHGLSIPAIIWRDVAPALADIGYRVLVYDLYGRGYSDAPETTYDSTLYTTQLAFLMQYLRWDKANIIGLSMGGGVAAAFTDQFPHLVGEGVGLIASAGLMESSEISRTAKFMSSPFVQSLTASRPVRSYIQRLANKSVPEKSINDDIIEIVRLQSAHLPGYNAALSSSLREGPIRGQSSTFHSKAFDGKRVLILHGTKDFTVPLRYAYQIDSSITDKATKKMVIVNGAGHDLTISHPSEVCEALVALLSGRGWDS